MNREQLLTMSTSANQPGAVVQVPPSVQQQYGVPQQLATSYQLPATQQQPATMQLQQVVQPQPPIMQAAPIQYVNQVAPQQQVYAPQYQPQQAPIMQAAPQQQAMYAPQYQPKPLQLQGQAPQYHGNQVAYSAQQGGVAQLIMSSDRMNPPNFNYKPNDYFILTIVVAVVFGIFFIGSLFCSIPAVVLSVKSKAATTAGNIKTGRRLGVFAVYLVVSAILFALIADIVLVGIGIAGRSSLYCRYSYSYSYSYSCRYYGR
ncbi:DNA translocase FtsK-like [Halichondria panicea]|uniref:DNA translocase FtsK-like n=1 Tax=Halichondria panicea TaxID=6063 RepID=UPI00312BA559